MDGVSCCCCGRVLALIGAVLILWRCPESCCVAARLSVTSCCVQQLETATSASLSPQTPTPHTVATRCHGSAPSTQLCSLLTLSSAVQCCSGRGVSSTDGVGVQCLVSCWCWLPRPGPATLLEKTMVPQLAAAPRTLHTPASTMVTWAHQPAAAAVETRPDPWPLTAWPARDRRPLLVTLRDAVLTDGWPRARVPWSVAGHAESCRVWGQSTQHSLSVQYNYF